MQAAQISVRLGNANPIIDRVLTESFRAIVEHLPEMYWSESRDQEYIGPTIPLYDALENCGMAITDGSLPILFDEELKAHGLLADLRKQIFENEAQMNGLSVRERRKKSIPAPQERDEPPSELCWLYFKDTPLLDFFNTPIPFRIPRDLFASHTFICAPPRHGKTQCIQSFCANFLNDPDPPGMFVLDPHGDLFNTLKERVDPQHLVVLDPETDPPPLNFLHFGTSSHVNALQSFIYLMSSLSGGLSDKQAGIAPYLFDLLKKMPTPTLDTLRLIVEDDAKTAEKSDLYPYIQQLEPRTQDFFRKQFFTGMKETRQAIAWKIYAAMGSSAFAQMFGASTNSFDAAQCMRERKVVLARGSETTLGEHGLPIFLQFIVSQCLMAALQRMSIPKRDRHLCLLIVDEAKHVFNNQTERILTECRKANLGYLAATQVLSQIPEAVRSAIYGATAIKIAGPVQSSDANQLSREMYCTPDFIRSMEPVRGSHADWAFYVQEVTVGHAVKVRVPYGVLERMPKAMSAETPRPLPSADSPVEIHNSRSTHIPESLPQSPDPTTPGEGRG